MTSLKWQLGEAAQAFHDGTSASNEYAIFNNTVQAEIDKARKRIGELAIELGEKLYPLMRHIYILPPPSCVSERARLLHHRAPQGYRSRYRDCRILFCGFSFVKTGHDSLARRPRCRKGCHDGIPHRHYIGAYNGHRSSRRMGAATHAMKLLNAVVKTNPFDCPFRHHRRGADYQVAD